MPWRWSFLLLPRILSTDKRPANKREMAVKATPERQEKIQNGWNSWWLFCGRQHGTGRLGNPPSVAMTTGATALIHSTRLLIFFFPTKFRVLPLLHQESDWIIEKNGATFKFRFEFFKNKKRRKFVVWEQWLRFFFRKKLIAFGVGRGAVKWPLDYSAAVFFLAVLSAATCAANSRSSVKSGPSLTAAFLKRKISFYVSAFAFEDRVMLHEFQFTSGGKVHILCHLWHNLQDLEQLGSRRLVQSSRKLKSEMEPVVLLHNSSHRTLFIQCPKLCKIKLCHLKWCAIDSARRTIIC